MSQPTQIELLKSAMKIQENISAKSSPQEEAKPNKKKKTKAQIKKAEKKG